jgi:hypothetical protein
LRSKWIVSVSPLCPVERAPRISNDIDTTMKSYGADYNVLCENFMQNSPCNRIQTTFWVFNVVWEIPIYVHSLWHSVVPVTQLIIDEIRMWLRNSLLTFSMIKPDCISHGCNDDFSGL